MAAQEGLFLSKPDDLPEYLTMSNTVYYGVSCTLYFLIVLISCVVGDISIVFGVIGANAVAFILFFAPASYMLRGAAIEGVQLGGAEKIGAYAWLFLGVAVCIWCNFTVFYGAFS